MSVSAKRTAISCDKVVLSQYLESTLSVLEQKGLESHLSECANCRATIESLAADGDFWTAASEALDAPKAIRLLRPTADLSLAALASSANGTDTLASELLSGDTPTETTLSQTTMLQRWLDPSNKENSLGRIGKYEVLGIVGQGGMGLVLKALDTELERMVALKTLAHHVTSRPDARLRLAREARAAAALRHPNIVAIFGMETWRDVPLIVMPLVEGGTLQQYASKQQLTTEQVLTTALQIACALAALHAAGIVHRDLKPSNILLQDGLEHVLLSDFGLARFDGDLAITHSDALAGTPFFMSPEQALGRSIDVRSDLFSFGSVLYWLCTGKYPFRGNSNYETLSKLIHSEANSDELVRRQVPSYLQRLIQRLLAKEPSERWSTAEEVVVLLRGSLAHYRSPAEDLPSGLAASPPVTRLISRWPLRTAVALLCVTVVILGLQYFEKFAGRPLETMTADSETKQDTKQAEGDQPTFTPSPRYGALDALDRRAMIADLEQGTKLHYWLRRLAYLQVDEIPPEVIPAIQMLSESADLASRELSQVILNKNPFQEVVILPNAIPNSFTTENPFQEVLPNE